jgi:hypothetical protein
VYICGVIKNNKNMYYILFYKKNEGGCQKKDGFLTRKTALEWLKTFWDDVDWYSIELEE